MREVVRKFNVYQYSELPEEAKEVAKKWYLDGRDSCDFSEIYEQDLRLLFPNSDLKLEYSLGYCQGDGLNIYGSLNPMDILMAIENPSVAGDTFKDFRNILSDKEVRTISFYANDLRCDITLPRNNSNYSYCVADQTEFADEWIDELEYECIRDIKSEVLVKFQDLVRKCFTMLAAQYEEYGYQFFYEVDEDEMKEASTVNEWGFYEDGRYYS